MKLLNEKQVANVAGGDWSHCYCDQNAVGTMVLGASGCIISCCWNRGAFSWRTVGRDTGMVAQGDCNPEPQMVAGVAVLGLLE